MSVTVNLMNDNAKTYAYSSSTAKSKDYDSSNSFSSNKNYASTSDFAEALFKLEDNCREQYSAITKNSGTDTVLKLKTEISKLFPEFTMVSSNPSNVSNGKNLLYIDNANLEKMVKDPSYKADVYALMKRELAGNDGYRINGSSWKMTGFVFSLSESNTSEGGIPYAGMCTSVCLDASTAFSGNGSKAKVSILSCLEASSSSKTDVKSKEKNKADKKVENISTDDDYLQKIWEKEKQRRKEYTDSLEEAAQDKSDYMEQYNQEWIKQKYEKNILYTD